jgi:hypothetical protein
MRSLVCKIAKRLIHVRDWLTGQRLAKARVLEQPVECGSMKTNYRAWNLAVASTCFALLVSFPLMLFGATNCAPPPFVASSAGIKPNVLIILDNSGSMINGPGNPGNYSESVKYYGFFDSTRIYQYDNGKHYFKDVGPAVSDGTKLYGAYNNKTHTGNSQAFSGNWLNWVLMTRLDVSKTVLTGGRLGGDPNEWVIVGTPNAIDSGGAMLSRDYNDNLSGTNLYYTPFHQNITVQMYDPNTTTWGDQTVNPPYADYIQRTGSAAPYVPLFKIFKQGTDTTKSSNLLSNGYGNIGETASSTRTVYDNTHSNRAVTKTDNRVGGYYKARYFGPVTGLPPQGVIQQVASRVRLGYMRFNEGTGPFDDPAYVQGQPALQRTTTSKGTSYMHVYDADNDAPNSSDTTYYEVIGAHADGGQVVNPCGDDTTVDSWQNDPNNPGNKIPILSIVKNINEEQSYPSTPLGEVLHEAMRYFQQKPPCYLPDCASGPGTPSAGVRCDNKPVNPSNPLADFQIGWDKSNSNLNWDPFYFKEYGDTLGCVYSSIILLTDGDPTWDYSANKCLDASAQSVDVSATLTKNGAYDPSGRPTGNGQFVDQIPYIMHTQDLRPELKPSGDTTVYPKPGGARTVTFYGILSYAGGTGNLLKQACITGGFQDLPYDQSGHNIGTVDQKPGPSSAEWLSAGRTDSSGNPVPNTYYEASTGDQIQNALLNIFTQITVQGTAGAVATVSQQTSAGDMVVRGGFNYKFDPTNNLTWWMGHLESYWPYSDGSYDFQINPGAFCKDILTPSKNCWDAGQNITRNVASQRNIFTYINTYTDTGTTSRAWTPKQVTFDIRSTSPDAVATRLAWLKLYLNPPDNSVSTDQQAKALIQWTRGEVNGSGYPVDNDGSTVLGTTYRTRSSSDVPGGQWILGDIIYSTPIIVAAPPASIPDSDPDFAAFQAFRSSDGTGGTPNIFYRNKIAYVGGNDGMVHAFLLEKWDSAHQMWLNKPGNDASQGQDPDIGKELWAYIPSNILPQLSQLAMPTYGSNSCQHLPMVDLAPQAYDVFINYKGTRQWRTVLIGGERGGGDVYFAIDVTDPSASDYPRVIWEYSVLRNLAVAYTDAGTDKVSLPYVSSSLYANLSDLPLAWTKPAVGRIPVPPGVKLPFFKLAYSQTQSSPLPNPVTVPDPVVTRTDSATEFTPTNKNRHIAFLGGGFRVFQSPWRTGVMPVPSNNETQQALFEPNLLAIDIETGYNIFQKIWPLIVKYQPTDSSKTPPQLIWPKLQTGTTGSPVTIPYALADPIGLDVWNTASAVVGEDGFIDTLYFGDLTGYFYSLKLNIIDSATQKTQPPPSSDSMQMLIQLRQTKPIEALVTGLTGTASVNNTPLNFYRYLNQPITSSPSAAWEEGDEPALRVLFGTGKLDDKDGTINDDFYDGRQSSANDAVTELPRAPGSFYNLKDPVQAWTITSSDKINFNLSSYGSSNSVDQVVSPPTTTNKWVFSMSSANLTIQIDKKTCPSTSYSPDTVTAPCADSTPGVRDLSKCCNWIRTSSDSDCGENMSSCNGGTPCWNCIFDFSTPGERVLDRPLIVNGTAYFTTVVPGESDPCLPGAGVGFTGNLYALDYMCRPLAVPPSGLLTPVSGSIAVSNLTNASGLIIGQQATILGGIPSRPVLDSSGQHLFVQTSNAAIQVIGIPPSTAAKIRGWRQK